MPGRYLLDTNILIALFARDPSVEGQVANADEVFIASINLGELYYGASKSSQVEANTARLDDLAGQSAVLSCDASTAKHYGHIKHRLRLRGKPIPENDIWVAAVAQQHALTLISRDTHFAEVEDLTVERW